MNKPTKDNSTIPIVLFVAFLFILQFSLSNETEDSIIQDQVEKFKRSCLDQRCVLEIKIKNKQKIIYTPDIENLSIGDTINLNESCQQIKGSKICKYKLKES